MFMMTQTSCPRRFYLCVKEKIKEIRGDRKITQRIFK